MPRSRAAPTPASRSASAAASRPRPSASSAPPPPAAPQHHASQPQSAGSTGWFGSRSSAPPPAPHSSAPPPAMQSPSGGGMMSGLLGSVVQGAALGTGSAIAHRAVDSMMGPRETRVVHDHQGAPEAAPQPAPMMPAAADGPCANRVKEFADCMSRYSGDMGACQQYFDAMQQCKMAFA